MFDSPASMAPSELNRAPTLPVEQETQAAGSGHVHQVCLFFAEIFHLLHMKHFDSL